MDQITQTSLAQIPDTNPPSTTIPLIEIRNNPKIESTTLPSHPTSSRKHIQRTIELNGVRALNIRTQTKANLKDPIVDLELIVNNPIGRLWLALKRIWKSQHTIISIRVSIPLFVLPIAIFIFWQIWNGNRVNLPITIIGTVRKMTLDGKETSILVLPNSTYFVLEFPQTYAGKRYTDKIVAISGIHHTASNTLTVEAEGVFGDDATTPSQTTSTSSQSKTSTLDTIQQFLHQFF